MADQGREARLKAALRQNLKRRKQQARKRAVPDQPAACKDAGGAVDETDAPAGSAAKRDEAGGAS